MKVFAVNLWLASKLYLQSNYLSILSLGLIISSPLLRTQWTQVRHSISGKAVTREELMEKLAKQGEITMRMRVIGMDINTGVIQAIHEPFVGGSG